MDEIDNIIEVYRQDGYEISREEAESILEAMEFAHEVWTSKQ
jgi:phosphomannomutase